MAFDAKVIKVFIACPNDVAKERDVVRTTINNWNALNAEEYEIIYLPVAWDMHAIPEMSKAPQDYINEEILDYCDILVALFRASLGSATGRSKSASVEEIMRHAAYGKRAMVYFSNEKVDIDKIDLKKANALKKWKKDIQPIAMYGEFSDAKDLSNLLEKHLTRLARDRKYRVEYDSDKLALIKNDDELIANISNHFPTVSYNLLKDIYDEERSDSVWDTMLDKLSNSPAEL